MISARHDCSPADALALIRARAFTIGSDVHVIASSIVRATRRTCSDAASAPPQPPDPGLTTSTVSRWIGLAQADEE